MYKLVISSFFEKSFDKLDIKTKKIIKAWIDKNLVNIEDPTTLSNYKKLKGNLSGLCRYRIGNYRLVVRINNEQLELIMVYIDKRASIYRNIERIYKNIKSKLFDK